MGDTLRILWTKLDYNFRLSVGICYSFLRNRDVGPLCALFITLGALRVRFRPVPLGNKHRV